MSHSGTAGDHFSNETFMYQKDVEVLKGQKASDFKKKNFENDMYYAVLHSLHWHKK